MRVEILKLSAVFDRVAEQINEDYHEGLCDIVDCGADLNVKKFDYVVIDKEDRVIIKSKGGLKNEKGTKFECVAGRKL